MQDFFLFGYYLNLPSCKKKRRQYCYYAFSFYSHDYWIKICRGMSELICIYFSPGVKGKRTESQGAEDPTKGRYSISLILLDVAFKIE
jgi:hypothetical protein